MSIEVTRRTASSSGMRPREVAASTDESRRPNESAVTGADSIELHVWPARSWIFSWSAQGSVRFCDTKPARARARCTSGACMKTAQTIPVLAFSA